MKRRALLASPVAALLAAALAGCPGKEPAVSPAPPPAGGDVAPPSSATPPAAKAAETWAEQAELVARTLEELVEAAGKGDKPAALKAHERAYFECYESVARNLEVASQRFLPTEKLDGRDRNVAIVREDLFAQVKTAVKAGAPATKLRELVNELETKIREDAKKLDEMKVSPP